MTSFCFIIAAARSGTTMLEDAVSRSFKAVWPPEVFHHQHFDPAVDFRRSPNMGERVSFFNFRHALFAEEPGFSFPSVENQSEILARDLEYLASLPDSDRYLLDVKYASTHHLNPTWHHFHQPPLLLTELQRLQIPLVHLKRRNLFALLCSQKLAAETGIWHVYDERPGGPPRLWHDPAVLVQILDDLRDAQRMFDRWLGEAPVHVFEYESLLDGDGFSKQVEEVFGSIFKMAPVEPLLTRNRKVTPPLRDVIANKNKKEILAALKGTAYQTMAEEALA
jgi:LPS sulfotransferase NodH